MSCGKLTFVKRSYNNNETIYYNIDIFHSIIKETNYLVRFLVFKTVISFMSSVIACGLQILNVSLYAFLK